MFWIVLAYAGVPSLNGYYSLATAPASVKAAQEASLQTALETFSVVLRPLAEAALRPTLFYCNNYQIAVDSSGFSLQCDQRTPIARSFSGGSLPVQWEGGTLQSDVAATDRELMIKLSSENGSRTSYFRPTASGLSLQVQVASRYLDKPMEWWIDYTRK
jgi:hypothetical protein